MTVQDHAPSWLRGLHDGESPDVHEQLLHNLGGMLQGWAAWPEAMDFLRPDSPNHGWKALMTRLYRARFDRFLPPAPARILDLACGSGRFMAPLTAEGYEVVGVDATRPSLEAAARHVPGAKLIWGDVCDLQDFVDQPVDAALAIELLCYLPDPGRVLAALAERMTPGAPLIVSVEAWPGAFLSDPGPPEAVERALQRHELVEPGARHVRCYTRQELHDLLVVGGFHPVLIEGSHYVLDGPLGALADPGRLDGAVYDESLLALEAQLRQHPDLGVLPRAWLAVARAR